METLVRKFLEKFAAFKGKGLRTVKIAGGILFKSHCSKFKSKLSFASSHLCATRATSLAIYESVSTNAINLEIMMKPIDFFFFFFLKGDVIIIVCVGRSLELNEISDISIKWQSNNNQKRRKRKEKERIKIPFILFVISSKMNLLK